MAGNLHCVDDAGHTPLHYAIKASGTAVGSGVDNCIREILGNNADLSLCDRDDCNAMHLCARYGQPEYLSLLVDRFVKKFYIYIYLYFLLFYYFFLFFFCYFFVIFLFFIFFIFLFSLLLFF